LASSTVDTLAYIAIFELIVSPFYRLCDGSYGALLIHSSEETRLIYLDVIQVEIITHISTVAVLTFSTIVPSPSDEAVSIFLDGIREE
jgi:hypothetical protein